MDNISRRLVLEPLGEGFDVRLEKFDPAAEREAAIDMLTKQTLDQLGVNADSPYVTHHDVQRAARLSAQLALQSVDHRNIFKILRSNENTTPTNTSERMNMTEGEK